MHGYERNERSAAATVQVRRQTSRDLRFNVQSSDGLRDDDMITDLSWIYVSTLSLSLIGSCSVVVVSIVKRRHLNEQAKPLLQLALADFLASLVLMITAIINLLNENWLFSERMCMRGLTLSLSAHAFQGWREKPVQEAFETQVSQVFPHEHTLSVTVVTAKLDQLVPIIGYVIYICTVQYIEATLTPARKPTLAPLNKGPTAKFCNSCILFVHLKNDSCITVDKAHANSIRIFPLTSVLMYRNTSMITMTQRHSGGIWSSARYMILVIIFCWAPALVVICLSFKSNTMSEIFPLHVIQALSVSLQGFLNSIVYAWRRRNFRDAVLGERLPLMAYSNRAFFDQSLNEPS
ncbi:Transmembrane protein 116 [Labeo rohita]|uniref:Transmembrane protein 116 n=1 Tax=Labeo rohita TaxID=84645 RepID=A0ABQ8LRX1_LABRO|nr:Transmembrane protein 116 [Labeo rohita]